MKNACIGILSCCILLLYASCNNALLKSEDVDGKAAYPNHRLFLKES